MLPLREQHTVAFLKMAAVQLRHLAKRAPDVASELLGVAEQLEAESADIEQRGEVV
jgi:hypothetical protein